MDYLFDIAKDYFLNGVECIDTKNYDDAIIWFNKSLELAPNKSSTFINMSVAYLKLGNLNEAKNFAQRALNLNPHDPIILNQIGLLSRRDGNEADALLNFKKCIEIEPNAFEYQLNYAQSLKNSGQIGESLEYFRIAININPDVSDAFISYSLALMELKKFDEALEILDKIIAIEANNARIYNNRAVVLVNLGRHHEAIENCNIAIQLDPELDEAYVNLSGILKELNLIDDAFKFIQKAISLNSDNANAYNILGIIHSDLSNLEEALTNYDNAITLDQNHEEAYANRGNALKNLGRIDEALDSFNKAIQIREDYATAYWNRSSIYLLKGEFERGFLEAEYRKLIDGKSSDFLPSELEWDGSEDLRGKILFIYPELYLGDMIQFCRYALLAEDLGAKVIIAAPDSLHKLLGTMSPTIEFISKDSRPEYFDYHCALMSLPFVFKTTLESVPAHVPYLHANSDLILKWKNRIGDEGFKIGICWQGSTEPYSIPMRRSFPLIHFKAISKIPNVRLISLQKKDGIDQLHNLPPDMKVETLGNDFDDGSDAFRDSAAVIKNLDLVITADTAIAHLAGALGSPTWVALKDVPDWRWLLERSDSPWYPSLRLFRQVHRDDWQPVFASIEKEILNILSHRN